MGKEYPDYESADFESAVWTALSREPRPVDNVHIGWVLHSIMKFCELGYSPTAVDFYVGIALTRLEERGMVKVTYSPQNDPIWRGRKLYSAVSLDELIKDAIQ